MRWRQTIGSRREEDSELELEREARRREAKWDEIERLPPRIASAVKLFVEVGDLRLA